MTKPNGSPRSRVGGFRFSGIACGIKASGATDLALVVADHPASVAGLFTTNLVKAAPVLISRSRVRSGRARAVIVNAGNANAATGEQGRRDALETTALVARAIGASPREVLVCSTGVIGRPLPMERVREGVPRAVAALADRGLAQAAQAILTTDTRPKVVARQVRLPGRRIVRIAGFAKGAGMIDPRMATMLAFVVTDAPVLPAHLSALLRESCEESFHRITIDGDRSTNDTLLAFASGAAGGRMLAPGKPGWADFRDGFAAVARDLALAIVADAEGWTRTLAVEVSGAGTKSDALRAARAIAKSPLVKTAAHGGDPNWGRILAAAGYSGARFDPARATVSIAGVKVYDRGVPAGAAPLARASRRMKARTLFPLSIDLARGRAEATVWTSDLSAEYVHINSDYTS